jgi:hypothetical protein
MKDREYLYMLYGVIETERVLGIRMDEVEWANIAQSLKEHLENE